MAELQDLFSGSVDMTDDEWAHFLSLLEKKEYAKRSLILRPEQVENYLYFIEKGIVRYYIPSIENEITFVFAFENWFMSAYESFLSRKPAGYCVESFTDTTLWRISYKDLCRFYKEVPSSEKLGRLCAERLFLIKSERELSFLTQTAEERYLSLFEKAPHLIRSIPLKYLSSYIGITPQALSRIRRRIS